jgi:cytoskeletal protein CcmA (bactofilin family)
MDNEVHAKYLNWEPHGTDVDTSRAQPSKQASPPKQEHSDAMDRRPELSVLGRSLVFKGELEADEDLLVDGRVEGTITHRAEHLAIGPHGDVKADITANRVLVQGRVVGNIRATETIVIEPSAHVTGNLFAPRIGLKEGAEFDGRIQMTRAAASATESKAQPAADTRPAASTGKAQLGERADARSAGTKRATSAKKAAAGGGMSDASVDDMLD